MTTTINIHKNQQWRLTINIIWWIIVGTSCEEVQVFLIDSDNHLPGARCLEPKKTIGLAVWPPPYNVLRLLLAKEDQLPPVCTRGFCNNRSPDKSVGEAKDIRRRNQIGGP
jgi:hypothetical protein